MTQPVRPQTNWNQIDEAPWQKEKRNLGQLLLGIGLSGAAWTT